MGSSWSREEAREGQAEERGEYSADLRIESRCAASEPSSLGIARADRRILVTSSMTMGAADRYYLTSEPNSPGIARAHLRSLLFLGMATVAAERHCPTISQNDHGSRRVPNPEETSGDGHHVIQIDQPEEQETLPTPTYAVQGLRAKIKTLGKKAMNRINRSIEVIPNELLVGLIGVECQYMSMLSPNGNSRYIQAAVNASAFLFLLIGMVRRARQCSCANLPLFMGILLSCGGILFSMSRDINGPLGWFVPVACLLVITTTMVI